VNFGEPAVSGVNELQRLANPLPEFGFAVADVALTPDGFRAEMMRTRLARELDSGIYEKHVREDFRSGVKSGVNGTPSFFINGERYDGSWANEDAFLARLRETAHTATT